MANTFIKADRVVRTMLAVLEREVVLPNLVWRDAAGDFRGAKDDTITIRLPAFTTARQRTLRAGTPVTVDDLDQTKVDVTLDTDVYKAVGITDEEMTLDIVDFGNEVIAPVIGAVSRGVEDVIAAEMNSATYETEIELDEDDPWLGVIDARQALNDAYVPPGMRALAVGSNVETAMLKSDRLSKFDQAGDANALREAMIGRYGGFTVVSVPALDADTAVAFHRTAFVLSSQAPVVPDGATWGTTTSSNGFALRSIRDYDFANTRDRLLTDVYVGADTVKDRGVINADGKFEPSVDGTASPILVRAVRLSLAGS